MTGLKGVSAELNAQQLWELESLQEATSVAIDTKSPVQVRYFGCIPAGDDMDTFDTSIRFASESAAALVDNSGWLNTVIALHVKYICRTILLRVLSPLLATIYDIYRYRLM